MSGERSVELERWYPEWSRQLAQAHSSGVSQLFILHGNVSDLIRLEKPDGTITYSMLPEFLATQIYGEWDSVLYYDQVRGPRAMAGTKARLEKINRHLERFIGPVEKLRETRQVGQVFSVLDRYLEQALLRGSEQPSISLILDYAHFMVPSSSVSNTARELAPTLATLLNWAKSPYFKRAPFAFNLISERLSDLHDSLTRNAHTMAVEIPFPDRTARLDFIRFAARGHSFDQLCQVGDEQLADFTAGLTLVNLQGLIQLAVRTSQRLTLENLKANKKRMIEAECQGLVEFVEPDHSLEMVVGQTEGKKRLSEDARLIREGRLDALPMGYLLCGPVGTGKTFMAECYAGSVGIPCVKLLNFRSKYVGETEGNLEKILKVLRVMGPVAVIIDEADAMLGDRSSGSDSGTSGRVFGQFAAQMGNTAYRGKIIWFLLTCRPDLLPIDIKRQGRCEVHIPLFYPETEEDFREMFLVMGKKNHIDISAREVPDLPHGMELSGADIEGIAGRSRRLALLEGSEEVTGVHLETAMRDFIPSAETEEKELQILAAVIEATDVKYLPARYREEIFSPQRRTALMERFRILREQLRHGA